MYARTRIAPGQAYIPHGPPGSPDSHTTYAARPLLDPKDQSGSRLLLYYAGGNGPHTGLRSGALSLRSIVKVQNPGHM